MKTIRVEIDADGHAQIDVQGVIGKSCEDLTCDLEVALGVVTGRDHKPMYHRREVRRERQAGR